VRDGFFKSSRSSRAVWEFSALLVGSTDDQFLLAESLYGALLVYAALSTLLPSSLLAPPSDYAAIADLDGASQEEVTP